MPDYTDNPETLEAEITAPEASAPDFDFEVLETPAANPAAPTSILSGRLAAFVDPDALEVSKLDPVGDVIARAIPEDGDTDADDNLGADWHDDLVYTGKHKDVLAPSGGNIRIILLNAEETRGAFAWCEMRKRPVILRDINFKIHGLAPLKNRKGSRGTPVTDDMLDIAMGYFQAKARRGGGGGWEIMPRLEELRRGISQAAQMRRIHPVREFLRKLPEWDGEPRLEEVFVKYLKTENNAYFQQAGKLAFVGPVARAMEPGCQYHLMFILEGEEGIKKSTFIREIGSGFSGEVSDGSMGKTTTWIEATRSLWIIEFPELSAWKGVNAARVTALMTTAVDRARMVWDTEETEYERGFVIWGTSNNRAYLTAKAGNRRYVPIPVGLQPGEEIDIEDLRANLEQLWAEALHVYHEIVIDRWQANAAKAEAKLMKLEGEPGDAEFADKRKKVLDQQDGGELPLFFTGKAAEYAKRFQASRRIEDNLDVMSNEIASGIAGEILKAAPGAKAGRFWSLVTIEGKTVLAKRLWCLNDISSDILELERPKHGPANNREIGKACDLIPWFEATGITERLPWQASSQRTYEVKNPKHPKYLELVRDAMIEKGILKPRSTDEEQALVDTNTTKPGGKLGTTHEQLQGANKNYPEAAQANQKAVDLRETGVAVQDGIAFPVGTA